MIVHALRIQARSEHQQEPGEAGRQVAQGGFP